MADRALVAKYLQRVAQQSDLRKLLQPTASSGGFETIEGIEAAEVRETREAARSGLQDVIEGRLPTPDQTAGLEAIILPKIRPVLDVVDGDFTTDHPLWLKLSQDMGDQQVRDRLRRALPSIGRIELPGHPRLPYGGTGFVVGTGIVMTNRHVAAIFASGVGIHQLAFKPGLRAGIDFLREFGRPPGRTFPVTRVVMIHPFWDMALLEVEGLTIPPLTFSRRDASADSTTEVAAIGYPAFDTRNNADVQNDLFRRVFGVKRLQPGTLDGRQNAESFGHLVSALRHNCSTLGGNSGSAVIDLSTGHVVALHFGGKEGVTNHSVPASELARDARVVNAGLTFAGASAVARTGEPEWAPFWVRADEVVFAADDASSSVNSRSAAPRGVAPPPPAAAPPVSTPSARSSPPQRGQAMADGSIQIVVPLPALHVTVRLGEAGAQQIEAHAVASATARAAASAATDDTVEKLVMPFHEEDYSSRTGYDADFLDGVTIPMPTAADRAVVAAAKDGSTVLHYQHFSIVMHAKRRMALVTASNVVADPKLKTPEPDRNYSRKGLSGLGENDQEKWFPDPRLDDEFQLPDAFYTRDDGAFDKGHVVRREDVAWGKTYDILRRANGDTYHVTNCSPQVADFNRSTLGVDNWGDLEDHVLKGAASERYCQFAGPVLDPSDEVFLGTVGGRVKVRVKIPSRYWKVIVVRTADGVASFGFILEQDLSDVPTEEFVAGRFSRFMLPLIELQNLASVRFPRIVLEADQHDTTEGLELAFNAGLKHRARLEEGMYA